MLTNRVQITRSVNEFFVVGDPTLLFKQSEHFLHHMRVVSRQTDNLREGNAGVL